jgi:BirA family biotin operon repressor/biotin-[acetyl-CoA-carboxylase] ligase
MSFKAGAPSTSAARDLLATLRASADRLHPLADRIVSYGVIGSTNDEALRLASLGAPEGTLVIADAQTSGRGRSGRLWFSPPGAGLYVSMVLRPALASEPSTPRLEARWTRLITLAAGVGVAEGIRTSTGLPVQIKWPNDIVIGDGQGPRAAERRWRKTAGILAEGSAVGEALHHVVLGFGVNVAVAPYTSQLAPQATCLEVEAGKTIDRGVVLVEILACFWARYRELEEGHSARVLERWRELSPSSAGARVGYVRDGEAREGVSAGIDGDGALLVRTSAGIDNVISGEVSWL